MDCCCPLDRTFEPSLVVAGDCSRVFGTWAGTHGPLGSIGCVRLLRELWWVFVVPHTDDVFFQPFGCAERSAAGVHVFCYVLSSAVRFGSVSMGGCGAKRCVAVYVHACSSCYTKCMGKCVFGRCACRDIYFLHFFLGCHVNVRLSHGAEDHVFVAQEDILLGVWRTFQLLPLVGPWSCLGPDLCLRLL